MIEKKYYICPKCELKQSDKEGEPCVVCRKSLRTDGIKSTICRRSICHNCGSTVDWRFNLTCPECKWLICRECGSCGCNY